MVVNWSCIWWGSCANWWFNNWTVQSAFHDLVRLDWHDGWHFKSLRGVRLPTLAVLHRMQESWLTSHCRWYNGFPPLLISAPQYACLVMCPSWPVPSISQFLCLYQQISTKVTVPNEKTFVSVTTWDVSLTYNGHWLRIPWNMYDSPYIKN